MSAADLDLVLQTLALSEAELLERVSSLESDLRVYRELAQLGIHALHDVTAERDRLRERLVRLRDEYRMLRVQLLRQEAAA